MAEFAIKLTKSAEGAEIVLGTSNIIKVSENSAKSTNVTLSGTSGTANVTVEGVTELATFNTDLATTASDFVVASAAAYLAVGLVLSNNGAVLFFTPVDSSVSYVSGSTANVSGNLAGAHSVGAQVLYSNQGASRKNVNVNESASTISTAAGTLIEVTDLADGTSVIQINADRVNDIAPIEAATPANGSKIMYDAEGASQDEIKVDETVTTLDSLIQAL